MKAQWIFVVCSFSLFVFLGGTGARDSQARMTGLLSSARQAEPLLSEVIERERIKWGLPKGLIEGVIMHESKFDETAFNPEKQSKCYRLAKRKADKERCGSVGLMQIVPRWHGGGRGEGYARHISRGAAFLGRRFAERQNALLALGDWNGDRSGKYAKAVIREAKRFGYSG